MGPYEVIEIEEITSYPFVEEPKERKK